MNLAGLLRSRLRMIRNGWRAPGGVRSARARRGHPAVAVTLVLLLATIFAYGLSALFGALAEGGARAAAAAPVLALVLSAALTGMLVFDVHHAVASMLLDPDLDWFRRAPLPARVVFGVKMLDSLPRTAALLVVLAVPALASWVARYPTPLWAYALWPVWLAALWAVPMGVGTALGMLLLTVVPARAARSALGLLSTLTLVVLWFGNSFLLPRLVEHGESLVAGLRAGGGVPVWLALVSPGHAIALALAAAAGGDVGRACLATLWLAFTGALSLVLAALVAQATFGALQDALAAPVGRRRARPRRRVRPAAMHAGARGLARAVIERDIRLFMRDWTVLGDILTAAVLWTLLPLLSARLVTATPALMVRAMLVALTVGLGYEIAARSVPFERRALVWARLAPVTPLRWVWAKWLATATLAVPIFLLAGLTLAWAVPLPAAEWVGTVAICLSALAVALSLGLLTGLIFGDPDWTNPRAMLTVTGRIVATGLLLAQAIGWLAWSALGWIHGGAIERSLIWLPPLAAAALVVAVTGSAARRVAHFGQRH